jgi:Holliday junction resolvase RusA-like endonuclease
MLRIEVRGRPAPQGSKRGVARFKGTGADRKIVGISQIEMSPHVGTWRDDVKAAAERVIEETGHAPWDCAVAGRIIFTVQKPKSAPRRKVTYPSKVPDLSKLLRSTEDALTAAGVWRDDARIVRYTELAKVYPGEDPDALPVPGAVIEIWPVAEEEGAVSA